jgi:Tripartite tricarboxylate transporter family receptor
MEVRPSFPASTVPEFIDYAKANSGKITMATAGSGRPPHVWGEMSKIMTGMNLTPVPHRRFRSGACKSYGPRGRRARLSIIDIIGVTCSDQAQTSFGSLLGDALDNVEELRRALRGSAVSGRTRMGLLKQDHLDPAKGPKRIWDLNTKPRALAS